MRSRLLHDLLYIVSPYVCRIVSMFTEAEILVHLGHRIPGTPSPPYHYSVRDWSTGHACTSYFGIFQGLNRNQRRRADWENMQEWKVYYRECEYNRQIKRQIRFVNARGATDAQMQERWKGRLFLDPLELFFVIARVSSVSIMTRCEADLLDKSQS